MKKEKLILIRKQQGYTQKDIAHVIPTDVSNYSRKESGNIKMTRREWLKIAAFLNVPVDDIYEERILSPLSNEYVSLLENEVKILKEENEKLKVQLETIRLVIN